MSKVIYCSIIFVIGFLFCPRGYSTTTPLTIPPVYGEKHNSDETVIEPESLFPGRTQSLQFSHFTWGAEIGSSIDMTGHDLSTFDADAQFGYKNSYIKMLGVGAGIHRAVRLGYNFMPVYGVLRTSFTAKPSLLFMNIQLGYSFNSFPGAKTVGDFTGSLGLGINLKQSGLFKSYLILSMEYQYYSDANRDLTGMDTHYIFFAKLGFGVNF